MDNKSESEKFLCRKFEHLYYCFDHDKKGYIEQKDAERQMENLLGTLRRQELEKGASDEEVEKRVKEFTEHWMPGAIRYHSEMARFAKNPGKISMQEFVTFNMSIHDHIKQSDTLPHWFDDALRLSYLKCWCCIDTGYLDENGLELLPGIGCDTKSICHQWLTDNNNKKIGMMEFLALIKGYYGSEDPEHISKFIHGYQ